MGYAEKVALPTIIDLRAVETIPALQGPVDSDRRLEGISVAFDIVCVAQIRCHLPISHKNHNAIQRRFFTLTRSLPPALRGDSYRYKNAHNQTKRDMAPVS
jgi:hypothetical protein